MKHVKTFSHHHRPGASRGARASFWQAACLLGCAMGAAASPTRITVQADKPGAAISPNLYGAFFEDINRGGDGGLYAEMVQNRSFEDNAQPLGWSLVKSDGADASITLDKSLPLNANNPTSMRLEILRTSGGRAGIASQGFKGVPQMPRDKPEAWSANFERATGRPSSGLAVRRGREYLFSLYARCGNGFSGPLTVSLETQGGAALATQTISGLGAGWRKFTARLTPSATDTDARLVVSAGSPGVVWLDMASLLPKDTYKGRSNGMRPDIAAMIAALHPKFLRFPGGSFSEGHVLADSWLWKETVGDVAARPGRWNIWGYRSSDGMGYHEYLQMCEDFGAVPLLVAHAGMAEKDFIPMDALEPWVQDTIDAIEYANGPATSKWGAMRAKNGHPKPFGLKYVEIGNENGMGYPWGGGTREDYMPRYKMFYDRIKARYPGIVTIANIHTEPDAPAEIVDEHYYNTPEWFLNETKRYDGYDRTKPKIYIGEYAVTGGGGNGNLKAALAEAAFLTGVERNGDAVAMTSYAPLLVNPDWRRWSPDAIVFDSARVYGTPSYHMQTMFGSNQGDFNLPVAVATPPSATDPPAPAADAALAQTAARPLFVCASLRKASGEIIVKVVNASGQPCESILDLSGSGRIAPRGAAWVLASASPDDENSFETPTKIAPRQESVAASTTIYRTFPPYSVTVLRMRKEKK